jgi:hypothetical protein
MMKRAFVSTILGIVLCALVFWLGGCGEYLARPGETEAEGHRRHLRILSINHQEMIQDIDRAIFWDKQSRASDITLP